MSNKSAMTNEAEADPSSDVINGQYHWLRLDVGRHITHSVQISDLSSATIPL